MGREERLRRRREQDRVEDRVRRSRKTAEEREVRLARRREHNRRRRDALTSLQRDAILE